MTEVLEGCLSCMLMSKPTQWDQVLDDCGKLLNTWFLAEVAVSN